MGNLNSGQLTLLAFAVLAIFAVLASVSLRRNIRGIRPATPEEIAAMDHSGRPSEESAPVEIEESTTLEEGLPSPDPASAEPGPVRRSGRGKRSPKASTRS